MSELIINVVGQTKPRELVENDYAHQQASVAATQVGQTAGHLRILFHRGNQRSVMVLEPVATLFAVCRLPADSDIPAWASRSKSFSSITRTPDELSIVCRHADVPEGVRLESPWRAFKVRGPLDFGLTGILASLAVPLADAGISIFALSTFDTDYVLVRSGEFAHASTVLSRAGHEIITAQTSNTPC